MSNTNSPPLCNTCHKPLEKRNCYSCDGKGYTRVLLFFEKYCRDCKGRGWVLDCPDAYQHALDRIHEITRMRPVNSQRFRSFTPKPTYKRLTPPPWWNRPGPLNPRNPNSPYNPNNFNSPLNRHNRPVHKNPFKK